MVSPCVLLALVVAWGALSATLERVLWMIASFSDGILLFFPDVLENRVQSAAAWFVALLGLEPVVLLGLRILSERRRAEE